MKLNHVYCVWIKNAVIEVHLIVKQEKRLGRTLYVIT